MRTARSPRKRSRARSSVFSSRSRMPTCQPAARSAPAQASPMPEAPPVTMAARPDADPRFALVLAEDFAFATALLPCFLFTLAALRALAHDDAERRGRAVLAPSRPQSMIPIMLHE